MKKKKIHRDKNGHEFIKESYFVGGKMKFRRIYVIDGISAEEFYEKNATDLDFYLNGDYELMNSEKNSSNHDHELNSAGAWLHRVPSDKIRPDSASL